MEVDEALGKLGVTGRWQILQYTLICIAFDVPPCFHMLAIIYIGNVAYSSTVSQNGPVFFVFARNVAKV